MVKALKKLKHKLEELPKDLFEQVIADSQNFIKDLKSLYNTRRKMGHLQLSVELRNINQKICFVSNKMSTLLSNAWNKRMIKDV